MPDREVLRIVAAFDSTQVSRGAHKAIRDIQAVGAAAEYVGRKQLTGVVQQMDKFLSWPTGKLRPTGRVIPPTPITAGPRAGQIAPGRTIPSKASADLQEFRENLLKTAEAGSINEKQMQKFLTRLALLRKAKLAEITDPKESAKAARAFTTLEKSLAGVQVKFAGASHEARGMQAEMMGLHQTTPEVSDRLMKAGSAAQGLMMGMGLASGNIMSAAFSIIFLRFSIPKLTLAVGALVFTLMTLKNILSAGISNMMEFGKAAEKLEVAGQRLTSFFRSQATANDILRQADELAKRTGESYDDLVSSLSELERYGMRTPTYIKAILDAAAATGKTVPEVTSLLTDLTKSQQLGTFGKELQDKVRQVAQDLNIPFKAFATSYTNSLDLAKAMEQHYSGSMDALAQTTERMEARIRAAWDSITKWVGTQWNRVRKTVLPALMQFFGAVEQGMGEAWEASGGAKEFNKNIIGLTAALQRALPTILAFGRWLGSALVNGLNLAVRATKLMIDVVRNLLTPFKLAEDAVHKFTSSIKTGIGLTPEWGVFIGGIISGLAKIKLPKLDLGGWIGTLFKKSPESNLGAASTEAADDLIKIITGIGDDAIKLLKTAPGVLLSGLKTLFIYEVGKALIFTAVEALIPVGNLQQSMTDLFDEAFSVAGIAMMTGNIPAAIGAGIVTAVGLGILESVRPGTATDLKKLWQNAMDWMFNPNRWLEDDATARRHWDEWARGQAALFAGPEAVDRYNRYLMDEYMANLANAQRLGLPLPSQPGFVEPNPLIKVRVSLLLDFANLAEDWKAWWGSWDTSEEAGGLLSRLRYQWDKIDLAAQWKVISTAFGFEFDLWRANWDRAWGSWDVPMESGGVLSRLRYQWERIRLVLPPIMGGPPGLQPGEPGYQGIPGLGGPAQHGLVVPGTPGTRRWVLADAGEVFGGHPTFAGARQRSGEGGTVVNIDLRGATIADDATARRIAGLIGDEVGRALSGRKRLSLHPI